MVNRYFFITVFLLLLLAPMVNDSFSIVQFERADENRVFHDSLVFNIQKLDNFPSDCENYLADNFSFRTPFIQLYKDIKLTVLHVAPSDNDESVIIGSDQRFFIASEEKKLYEREQILSDTQLDSFQAEWKIRKTYFKKRGIKSFFMIAPSALEVYAHNLPFNVQKLAPNNLSMQLQKRLNKKDPNFVLYPLKYLKDKSENENLYFKLDNHWNQLGAYYATNELLKVIKKQIKKTNFTFMKQVKLTVEEKKGGYLATLIGKPNYTENVPIISFTKQTSREIEKFGFPVTAGFPYPANYERHFINPSSNNKQRVLIIRDSFGDDCVPFIAEAFSETLFIFDGWKYGFNKEIIEQYKPDIIIYIMYEAHTLNFIR